MSTMDAETLAALKGSIAKWEAIVAGTGREDGPNNCPLCKMFYFKVDCKGCPVRERTGKEACQGTPYEDFVRARNRGWSGVMADEAQHELDFLKSLLPVQP